MKAKSKILIAALILAAFVVFGLNLVSSNKVGCVGRHNVQADRNSMPSVHVGEFDNTHTFVLPEVSGFKDIYQDFSVESGKIVVLCAEPGPCNLLVNGQLCIEGIEAGRTLLLDLGCKDLFHDGINTMTLEGTEEFPITTAIHWLFLETKIWSPFC